MDAPAADYDPRYLAGVRYFNDGDYFEAHEVWEDPWAEAAGAQRRFYQGLIQAAVGLFHFHSGNLRGARKLYATSREYMRGLDPVVHGLDIESFWQQMDRCFAPLLAAAESVRTLEPDPRHIPHIVLTPPPASWPERERATVSDQHSASQGDRGALI